VPVPLFLAGRAVNAGVLSALARVGREDRQPLLQTYVKMAQMLASAD
jgi:hypothetical protein